MRLTSAIAALAGPALLLAGCTIVEVRGDGRPATLQFGVLRIDPGAGARAVILRSHGVGLVPGLDGATLGARSESAALIYAPEDCRLVLFDPQPGAVTAAVDAMVARGGDRSTICIVGEGK